jgi:hypothetical protein
MMAIIALIAAGIATTYFYYQNNDWKTVEIKAGLEVSAISLEAIRQLSYRTPTMIFVAQRSDEGQFSVRITFHNGKPSRSCTVSSDLDGNLTALNMLTAKSGEVPVSDYPVPGVLEIKSMLKDDPDLSPIEFQRRADMHGIAVYQGQAFATDVPYQALTALEELCKH